MPFGFPVWTALNITFEAFGGLIPVSGRCFIDTKLVLNDIKGAAGAVKCGQSEWNIWGRLSRDGQVKKNSQIF